jgi:hypothetical protein
VTAPSYPTISGITAVGDLCFIIGAARRDPARLRHSFVFAHQNITSHRVLPRIRFHSSFVILSMWSP